MVVHRAANIEEHQQVDGIAPLGPRPDVEIAVLGGRLDGAVEVELLIGAFAYPAAQSLQRYLDVARADLDAVVQIAELAPVPDLDGAAVTRLVLADAHALGIVAIRAEGRGSGSADPFRSALMALLLLREALAQGLHQLVEAAQGLDQLLVFLRQMLLGKTHQPVERQFMRLDPGAANGL